MLCGERIKTLRTEAKKTQNEMAKILGMKQPHYARYESNERDTPMEKLTILADYFETSIDFLAKRTDERKPYPPTEED